MNEWIRFLWCQEDTCSTQRAKHESKLQTGTEKAKNKYIDREKEKNGNHYTSISIL